MAETKRKIVWSPGARIELEEAVAYIALDSPGYAGAFLEEALAKAESLVLFPRRGRVVPELRDPDVREVFVASYRLVYEIAGSEIHVLAFLHGARDFHRGWSS